MYFHVKVIILSILFWCLDCGISSRRAFALSLFPSPTFWQKAIPLSRTPAFKHHFWKNSCIGILPADPSSLALFTQVKVKLTPLLDSKMTYLYFKQLRKFYIFINKQIIRLSYQQVSYEMACHLSFLWNWRWKHCCRSKIIFYLNICRMWF